MDTFTKPIQAKKPYAAPTLLVYGTLEEITRGGVIGGNPPPAGQSGSTGQSNQNAASGPSSGTSAGSHIAAR